VVLVVTVRALRIHGCGDAHGAGKTEEIERGMKHLERHVRSVRMFGFEPVIAVNCFAGDREGDLQSIITGCRERGLKVACTMAYTEGGAGAEVLAEEVIAAASRPQPTERFLYDLDQSPTEKIAAVAGTIYGAADLEISRSAKKDLERINCLGYERLPVCIAKTHLSLTDDPRRVGVPDEFVLPVESVRIAAGAGYLLALTGDIMTMPGLPREPAAYRIDLSDDGEIKGI
jgi:formate--tetrahydrofolate ligase